MNIAFVSGSLKEAEFLSRIAEYLRTYDVESYFVYTREHIYNFFKDKQDTNIFFKGYFNETTCSDITYYSNKYKDFNLSLLVHSDPVLCKRNFEFGLKVVISYLRFWERLFQEKNLKAVAHYPTANVVGRTAYVVSKKFGAKHLVFQTGPVLDKNFTICDINEDWMWNEFLRVYENDDTPSGDGVHNEINILVEKVISTKNKMLKIRKVTLKVLLAFLYRSIKYHRYDEIELNEFKKLFFPFLRKIRLTVFKYDLADKRDKYVFFPLHISWDAQIATRNPMFSDQLYLVRMLSKSLPYGYYLYVKEHPYNYGGERVRLLKSIKSFQNVKLIHPEASSIDLITNARAVVTINSTAGWEAIILNKPLITFGRSFYSNFKYAEPINSMRELPSIIQKVLFRDWNSLVKQTNYVNNWKKFLWSVLSTAYEGAAISYKKYMGLDANVLNDNVTTTAESIYRKLSKLNI